MIHDTPNGWFWDVDPQIRTYAPIPHQMQLTKEDIAECMPKFKQKDLFLEQNEMWIRKYGISLVFKKDGKWFTNYRSKENQNG